MADPTTHPLSQTQQINLRALTAAADHATQKAQAYFQGCVDATDIDQEQFTVRLSEDCSALMVIPKQTPERADSAE